MPIIIHKLPFFAEPKPVEFQGRRIAVWGLAFKPDTDDIRESPGIDLTHRLFARGADVCVYDPKAMDNARQVLSPHISFAKTALDATIGAEALIVCTEWKEFREVSFEALRSQMIEPWIFDGRNHLADLHLSKKGFQYHGIGFVPV